eukprot:7371741-Prymnesium_polylepis.2
MAGRPFHLLRRLALRLPPLGHRRRGRDHPHVRRPLAPTCPALRARATCHVPSRTMSTAVHNMFTVCPLSHVLSRDLPHVTLPHTPSRHVARYLEKYAGPSEDLTLHAFDVVKPIADIGA